MPHRLYLTLVMSIGLLAACATTPPPPAPRLDSLLRDEAFGPKPADVDPAQVFAISDEMRRYVRDEMATLIHRRGPIYGLLDALYDKGKLKLEYDAVHTRTATEAFAARQGNCLSLVIMTGALARELGVDVQYQTVHGPTEWRKINDLYVVAGHVNLRLDAIPHDFGRVVRSSTGLTVDFQPGTNLQQQLVSPIAEATVMAMFMNNRAAESLGAGDLDQAYWWAQSALRQDERFIAAYNTLSVIYQRKGLGKDAIALLEYAVKAAPEDTVALGNLANFLRSAGRLADANVVDARLKAIEPYPPYHFFQRGLAAMQSNDYVTARNYFRKDLARQPYNAEFHFGLAATYIAEGDWQHAREHLSQAREYGATANSRALYSAKLDSLEHQLKQANCRRSSCDRSG